MSCEFEEDLTALVDGELPSLRAKQVEAHLAGCADCAATLGKVRSAVAQLTRLAAQERAQPGASPSLRRAVLTRLDEPAGWWARLREGWQPSVFMPALGLGASAVVCVLMLGGPQPEPGLESSEQALFAMNGEVLDDFEVVGLNDIDDLEVVQHLHELEVMP